MADVRLTIAGRPYDVHCSDGQEQQLLALGAMVDEKAQGAVGTTEVRQLLFSALFLADELKDARTGIPKSTPETDTLRAQLADAEEREAALRSELQALRDHSAELKQQHVQQLADTQAALQAAHVALTEAEVVADNAVDEAQAARADAEAAAQLLSELQAQQTSSGPPADPAKASAQAMALSQLADRIEALADKFEELS